MFFMDKDKQENIKKNNPKVIRVYDENEELIEDKMQQIFEGFLEKNNKNT